MVIASMCSGNGGVGCGRLAMGEDADRTRQMGSGCSFGNGNSSDTNSIDRRGVNRRKPVVVVIADV